MKDIFSFYRTTNLINGKIYYGVHKETKWPGVDEYLGSGHLLREAIKKYGKENFIRTILCISQTAEYVYELERQFVTEEFINCDVNYNIVGGGYGASCRSLITRERIGAAHKGKVVSEETKRKLSILNTGKQLSEDTKRKIAEANRGRKHTEETKRKLSEARRGENNPWYGQKHTEETKEIIRAKNSGEKHHGWGRKRPAEVVEKVAAAKRGVRLSEQHKANISKGLKGRKFSEEHRRKISENRKAYYERKRKEREVNTSLSEENYITVTDFAKLRG